MEANDRKLILVTRRTRLQELVARTNTVEQARFQAERLGMDFSDFLDEDRRYQAAVAQVATALDARGRLQRLDRGFLPNFLFPPDAIVVVVGQDGLVANTLKYLDGQPVLAVNPDRARWDGVLLPFAPDDVSRVLPDVLRGARGVREVTMARATLSDGQTLLAVNDFFIGARTHVSARYALNVGDRQEAQSSSGIIVSTGLGSTGWLRSVLTGAQALAGDAIEVDPGGHAHVGAAGHEDPSNDAAQLRAHGLPWDAERLVFSVREPYPSRSTGATLVFGRIDAATTFCVRSLMPEHGVIFSDGMEADGVDFRSGVEATVDLAPRRGRLLH